MWHESQPVGSCEAALVTLGSPRPKRSFCSRCSTTSTATGLRGGPKPSSRKTSESLGSRSTKHSRGCAIVGCSLSMSRVDRGERHAIGSETLAHCNLSHNPTGSMAQTCRVSGASCHRATCRLTWLEVITTHVRRSAGLSSLDVLRPTHRPTRPHPSSVAKKNLIHTIGQLAARCPSGEEAQRDLTLRARKRATRHLPAWLRSCPLPGAPADDREAGGSGLYLLAVGTRDKRDVWGLSAQPKVRAGGNAMEEETSGRAGHPMWQDKQRIESRKR